MRATDRVVPESASAENRATVEMLAGIPFENLWGNNNIGYLNRNKPAAPALKGHAPEFDTTQRLS